MSVVPDMGLPNTMSEVEYDARTLGLPHVPGYARFD